jgi:undecaprenyl-diphosphatase
MFEYLLQNDQELLIYLNNLGSNQWDSLWLIITNQRNWIPLFAFILFLVIKAFGWKKGGFTILMMILFVAFSDQFTNFVKDFFLRLRPNNDLLINTQLRTLINPQSHSFYSGHAATSTAFIVFVILLLKETYRYIWFLILFPLIFSYSRVYLGVHFPLDIFTGMLAGSLLAIIYYRLYMLLDKKLFS